MSARKGLAPEWEARAVLVRDELRELVVAGKIRQREIAERVGVHESSVCLWLEGTHLPRPDRIEALERIRAEIEGPAVAEPSSLDPGVASMIARSDPAAQLRILAAWLRAFLATRPDLGGEVPADVREILGLTAGILSRLKISRRIS